MPTHPLRVCPVLEEPLIRRLDHFLACLADLVATQILLAQSCAFHVPKEPTVQRLVRILCCLALSVQQGRMV